MKKIPPNPTDVAEISDGWIAGKVDLLLSGIALGLEQDEIKESLEALILVAYMEGAISTLNHWSEMTEDVFDEIQKRVQPLSCTDS